MLVRNWSSDGRYFGHKDQTQVMVANGMEMINRFAHLGADNAQAHLPCAEQNTPRQWESVNQKEGAPTPDLYSIDVIWSGILNP